MMEKTFNLLCKSLTGIAVLSLMAALAIYFHMTQITFLSNSTETPKTPNIGIILICILSVIFITTVVLMIIGLFLIIKESKSNVLTEIKQLTDDNKKLKEKMKEMIPGDDLAYREKLLNHELEMAKIKYRK